MAKGKVTAADLPVVGFESQSGWADWLEANHAKSSGVWLRLAKKNSGVQSVSYDEAIEEALCFGWIDGQKKAYDEATWLQRMTPRGPRSIWSRINRDKAEALFAAGRLQAGETGWPVGRGLRLAERRHRAARFAGGARQERSGKGFFRQLEQRQPLRHPAPDSNRHQARDAHATHPQVRRDVEERREDPSLSFVVTRGRHFSVLVVLAVLDCPCSLFLPHRLF
jgi:hypothetical protein